MSARIPPSRATARLRSRLLFVTSAAVAIVLLLTIAPISVDSNATADSASSSVQPVIDLGTAGAYSALASGKLTADGGSAAGKSGSSNEDPTTRAQLDLAAAYDSIAALTPTAQISDDLGGRTITPGIYHSAAALAVTSSVTFDALGDPNAVFIFQVDAAITTTAGSTMVLRHGARASRIYWQMAGAVTTGASSAFIGTILGNAAVTTGDGTTLEGRALTKGGAVTLDGTTLLPVPDLSMSSSVTPTIDVEAGDSVVFSNVIRNTGNVDLTLELNTGLPASATTAISWPDSTRILSAGQSVTALTSYVPTLADAVKRSITSNATVIGTPVGFRAVAASSSVRLAVYPTPVADSVTTVEGTPVTFNVLTNDAGAEIGGTFSRATLGTKRRLIGHATGPVPSQPVNGSVTCVDSGIERGVCTYQPAGHFVGTDTVDYTLSQDTRSWNVRVTIIVTPTTAPPIARDNRVVAMAGGPPVTFDPRSNATDPSTGTLTIISTSAVPAGEGSLNCTATFCIYTPPETGGFTGSATATFTVADTTTTGLSGTTSTPATITVFVDPPSLSQSGFVAADSTATAISLATWTGSTTITDVTSTCFNGRPSSSLTWKPRGETTTWELERRQAGSIVGPWILIATLPSTTTSYTDTQLGEGNSYEWQVRPDRNRWQGVFSPASDLSSEAPAVSAAGC